MMFRVLWREVLISLGALVALAFAALALARAFGPPALPNWNTLWAEVSAGPAGWSSHLTAVGTTARLGCDVLLALLAGLVVLRIVVAALLLLRLDYAFLAHLGIALRLPVVRRAGATAAVGLLLAPLTTAASASGAARRAIPHIAPITAPRQLTPAGDRQAAERTRTETKSRTVKTVVKRAGLALRYTVQPGDTLGLVADRLYGDWRQYTRIWRASRRLEQPGGVHLTNPNVIYPGWTLLVPLPIPALGVSGEHAVYIVQPGDTESLIAARFLGDWRRYPEIDQLNRGVRQPDGGRLEDSNLIQPGWVLRLPTDVITPYTLPAHLKGLRPCGTVGRHASPAPAHVRPPGAPVHPGPREHPRPAGHQHSRHSPGKASRHLAAHRRASVRPQRHVYLKRHIAVRRPHPAHRVLVRHHAHPEPHRRHAQRTAPTTPVATPPLPTVQPLPTTPAPRHSTHRVQPTRRIRPKKHVHPHSNLHATRRRASGDHPRKTQHRAHHGQHAHGAPLGQQGAQHGPHGAPHDGSGTRPGAGAPPSIRLPGSPRLVALAFVATLLTLCALVALKRRRGLTGLRGVPARAGTRLVPSMRRAVEAAQNGVSGRLALALRKVEGPARDGRIVRYVLTALERAGTAAGLPAGLAALTRVMTESAETIILTVEARRLSDQTLAAVARALSAAVGTPVQSERLVEADGMPCVHLTLKRSQIAVPLPTDADAAPPPPHPAPLLIPLGQTADGTVVHVNLGRLAPLLVVGGAQGSNTLVATLLASTLAQASPADLRLLVSSDDEELRAMLPVLEHLEAPPADTRDCAAAANIVAQAHCLVLERFVAGEAGPVGPDYLVVLANIEDLRADPRALDRLDAVCRNGRVCGVHVLTTTSNPRALAEVGLLEPFGTRLARPLGVEESHLLYGDDRAGRLGPEEIVLGQGVGTHGPVDNYRLLPFALTLPEVREVFATVAVALDVEGSTPAADSAQGADSAPSSDGAGEGAMLQQPGPAPQEPGSSRLPQPAEARQESHATADPDPDADTTATAEEKERMDVAAAGPVPPSPTGRAGNLQETVIHPPSPPSHAPNTVTPTPRAEATPHLQIHVFGGITVLMRGVPVVLQPREQRLLAALAIIGPEPVSPDRLIETLFPDDDPISGQDKLQHAITDIRAVFKRAGLPVKRAGVVRYTMAGYQLDRALVRVDAYLFRELLRKSETADSAERGTLLAQAVDLYSGDLCGAQALDWVEPYRHSWRKEYLEALYELAVYYEEVEKDLLGALRVARRLATEEPLQDHYHQMVLELIAATGDLDALDRHYQEMSAVFAQYSTEMDPYTHTLHERLRGQVTRERDRTDGANSKAS